MVKKVEKAVTEHGAIPEELIWERVARSKRSSSQRNYARIVKAAIRIADREGLEAISMRRIAVELDMGTMSLYRYVASKDQILDLAMDAAFGEIALPNKPRRSWQNDLRELARETRNTLKRHPWLAALLASRPTLGPNYLRWTEFALATTSSTGLGPSTGMLAVGTLYAFVSGAVAYEVAEAEANRAHDLTPERKRELAAPYLERIVGSGLYPHLADYFQSATGEASDEGFEFGLNCVLTGIKGVLSGVAGRK